MPHEITVEHYFDAGHRIVGHEGGKGKCARLHGHTYRVVVTLRGAELDESGFLADFGVVKRIIDEWDHHMILWDKDPVRVSDVVARMEDPEREWTRELLDAHSGIVRVPWNPTAENMARSLAEKLCELPGVREASVLLSETAKTSAAYTAHQGEQR